MNRREAKRLACWVVAGLVKGQLNAGWELEVHFPEEEPEDSPDLLRLYAAIEELVGELERRGHE